MIVLNYIQRYFVFLMLLVTVSSISQTVEEIEIKNTKRTKVSFLKSLIQTKEGEKLDTLLVQKDVQRLNRLLGIANTEYAITSKSNETVKVTYTVQENFTLIPSINVYTTNDGEFAYRIGLYEFNALGRNIAVGGYFQRDIYNSFGLNFRAPYLFSNKLGLAVNYQDLTTQEPVFFDNNTADYKYNIKSIEASVLYEFNFHHAIEFGGNYFIEDYEYKSGGTSPDVPQNLNVDKYAVKSFYQYNNVNTHYYFVMGVKNLLTLQYVHSSENTLPNFFIGWNDFIYYKRIGKRGNWASRFRMGLATNSESPFAPFSVDNNLNIRGVGNTIDRGTGSLVLNTEYRHTLYEKGWFVLQGNAFIDAGTWRNPGGDFGDFAESQNIRVYPGLGIRLIHKKIYNAVFRIDYGYGITEDATQGVVFGIRQYF